MTPPDRIFLSPPHQSGREGEALERALASNWIAPVGPENTAFEREFAARVGREHALATASGTAAIHLALRVLGVERGDHVLVSSFTFVATVAPVVQMGAIPVLIDSEPRSWNMDPALLREALADLRGRGAPIGAVLAVDLYGQTADWEAIDAVCREFEVPLIEDAAEALGATHRGRPAGGYGTFAIFSFNGNKIITTSGGGMLVSDDRDLLEHARKLAQQARDPAPWYEHTELGYNYRLSNLLAAVGREQLAVLGDRVAARRRNFERYRERLGDLPGIDFQPEAPWGTHTRWLTCLTIDPERFGAGWREVYDALESENVESRPLWKPMHLQPVFDGAITVGGEVSAGLFERGLCLPSGSSLTEAELDRVAAIVRSVGAVRAG